VLDDRLPAWRPSVLGLAPVADEVSSFLCGYGFLPRSRPGGGGCFESWLPDLTEDEQELAVRVGRLRRRARRSWPFLTASEERDCRRLSEEAPFWLDYPELSVFAFVARSYAEFVKYRDRRPDLAAQDEQERAVALWMARQGRLSQRRGQAGWWGLDWRKIRILDEVCPGWADSRPHEDAYELHRSLQEWLDRPGAGSRFAGDFRSRGSCSVDQLVHVAGSFVDLVKDAPAPDELWVWSKDLMSEASGRAGTRERGAGPFVAEWALASCAPGEPVVCVGGMSSHDFAGPGLG
jgi:hypothetical protein